MRVDVGDLLLDPASMPLRCPSDVRVLREKTRIFTVWVNRVHLEAMVQVSGDGEEDVGVRCVATASAGHPFDEVLNLTEPERIHRERV